MVLGPVFTRWAASGRIGGVLGYPTKDTAREDDGAGWRGLFQHGGISVSSHGSHVVRDPHWNAWRGQLGPAGPLGYPIAGTAAVSNGSGTHTDFQHGAISTSAATGTHAVWGPIFSSWVADFGRETGQLGYPTTNIKSGGKFNGMMLEGVIAF